MNFEVATSRPDDYLFGDKVKGEYFGSNEQILKLRLTNGTVKMDSSREREREDDRRCSALWPRERIDSPSMTK